LKITRRTPFDAQARPEPPSPPETGRAPEPQQNRETTLMTMLSEKALALVLAVAVSGTAFNTFIV
jgi:hypothetical protein